MDRFALSAVHHRSSVINQGHTIITIIIIIVSFFFSPSIHLSMNVKDVQTSSVSSPIAPLPIISSALPEDVSSHPDYLAMLVRIKQQYARLFVEYEDPSLVWLDNDDDHPHPYPRVQYKGQLSSYRPIVWDELCPSVESWARMIEDELKVYNRIPHDCPFIMPLLAWALSPSCSHVIFIFPLMEYTLMDKMCDSSFWSSMDEGDLCHLMLSVSESLVLMHKHHLVHGDVKAENIFYKSKDDTSPPRYGNVKTAQNGRPMLDPGDNKTPYTDSSDTYLFGVLVKDLTELFEATHSEPPEHI
eukprot:TRINITY_DN6773_c0_g4_i1.p2 TRINITY_DN6773_c0_g4~~TRINITY_DN6773_c0_g4_i1.p2  ORF type:complete len:300 (+),score=53.98 TRINITY_DN6773_c0_g4_i1:1252-2151(+)